MYGTEWPPTLAEICGIIKIFIVANNFYASGLNITKKKTVINFICRFEINEVRMNEILANICSVNGTFLKCLPRIFSGYYLCRCIFLLSHFHPKRSIRIKLIRMLEILDKL